jgi:Protein of unknown function (DUF2829).
MEFGQALTGLKHGSRATREGWNGKGMWVVLVGASHYDVGARTVGLNVRKDPTPNLRPWLGLKAHNGDFVPWVASQSDILADDWVVLDAEDYVNKFEVRIPLDGDVRSNLYELGEAAGAKLEKLDAIFSVQVVRIETVDALVVQSNVVEAVAHKSETRMKSFNDRMPNGRALSIQVDTQMWEACAHAAPTAGVELFAVLRIEYGQRNRRSD